MKLVLFAIIAFVCLFFGLKKCAGGGDSVKASMPGIPGLSGTKEEKPSDKPPLPKDQKDAPQFRTSSLFRFSNRPVPAVDALGRSGEGDEGISWSVDPQSNSVLVRGEAKAVADFVAALAQMDIPGDEAFIDGTMMFVRGDRVKDFEAAISYREGASWTGSATLSPGGFGVVLPWDAFNVSFSWLSENGFLEVIDKPQVRLASGEISEVTTGSEVAVPTTTFSETVTQTSIQFRRVGLTFKVRPLFLGGGRVRLDVEAENGVLGAPQKVADVEVPTITSQRVKSVATMSFDDGLVIGGLETVRREQRFGLLGKSERVEAGRLYLLLVLRSGQPKALPVDPGAFWSDWEAPATLPSGDDFPGSLLPPPDWQSEERTFLRGRTHPSK